MKYKTLLKMRMSTLFIDLDGTLVDTIELLKNSYFSFLKNFNIQGSPEEFHSLAHKPSLEDCLAHLKDRYQLKEPLQKLILAYFDILKPRYSAAPLFDDVLPFIEKAKKVGMQLIITTAAPLDLATLVLQNRGIAGAFDSIQTPQTMNYSKHNPLFFSTLLDKLNLKPDDVLLIEDSPHVVMTAKSTKISAALIARKRSPFPLPYFTSLPKILDAI